MGIPDDFAIRYSKSDMPIAAVSQTAEVRKWRADEAAIVRAKEAEQLQLRAQKQRLKEEQEARAAVEAAAKTAAKAGACVTLLADWIRCTHLIFSPPPSINHISQPSILHPKQNQQPRATRRSRRRPTCPRASPRPRRP